MNHVSSGIRRALAYGLSPEMRRTSIADVALPSSPSR